ncbi:coenzyme F420-0:L-glutamate ligase [Xanthobacter sp. KR7-225]|uniref:coenzyme F420-0:L-glutamate ligase n=1 Tax=Xanthobacter sp. KR7-225 TaxID=3156613 RepID=UPI0032B5A0B9
MPSLTLHALEDMPMIEPGDDLGSIIAGCVRTAGIGLERGDVVVIAQKIVSKAEGRYADLDAVEPSARALELAAATGKDPHHVEWVLRESREVVRHAPGVLVVEHLLGFVMANAGIDESNIPQEAGRRRVLLLPRDPDRSCARLKSELEAAFSTEVGVVMNDSFGRPWRQGVVGVALGAAGLPALRDMAGKPDLFGRPLRITEIAVADELAAAASLLMGQADEGRPVVVVRGLPFSGEARPAAALVRAKGRDLFR